jgi:hypothetical protein
VGVSARVADNNPMINATAGAIPGPGR